MINGNTKGIKQYILEEMEQIYEYSCGYNEFISPMLINLLARYTSLLEREISIYLSRGGKVLDVSIGDNDHVSLPYVRKRRGIHGLSGVRCIHTHPGGSSQLSQVDIGTLLSSRLDSMAALAVRDGEAKSLQAGFIGETLTEPVLYGPYHVARIPQAAFMAEIERATARVADLVRLQETGNQKERAILVGVGAQDSEMQELAMLADTAGAEVIGKMTQGKPNRDAGVYVGKGKIKELQLAISAVDADLIIVNDELSAIEQRNLEEQLGVKVIDRTVLILDIFARHAKTREGKLQVELAQLKYNLPRLMGEGLSLSRLGAGIGTRGPGETKLESDRRRIRRRIFELEREIDKLSEQRTLRRAQREKNQMKEIALVGYTNAGKTSLLNAISGAGQYAENKLFATLDPVTRKFTLPSGKEVLLTDTVGFVDKLPHDLVSAFRSTLEEATRADLLLNVTDASNPDNLHQMQVVRQVISDLGAQDKPMLAVFNKADLLESAPQIAAPNSYYVSAHTGQGLEQLLEAIDKALMPRLMRISLKLGYHEGARLAQLQANAEDIRIEYLDDRMEITALLPEAAAKRILSGK
ncbi:MAG: GTPase HflX [Clostridia bacterium]|nr:GTPase HflX [Clostridia bacterium]